MIVKCAYCGRQIKRKKDLVVTMHTEHVSLVPHHEACHPKAWRKKKFQYLLDVEINKKSGSGSILVLSAVLLAVSLMIYSQFDATGFMPWLLLSVVSAMLTAGLLSIRLASWLWFERWLR